MRQFWSTNLILESYMTVRPGDHFEFRGIIRGFSKILNDKYV